MKTKNTNLASSLWSIMSLCFGGWLIWFTVTTVMNFLLSIIWLILTIFGVWGFVITWHHYYSIGTNLPTKKALVNLSTTLKKPHKLSTEDRVVIKRFLNHCESVLGTNETMMCLVKDLKKRCNSEDIIDLDNVTRRK